jgi:GH15 family glucan-1,4-alpha-glucosidase
MRSHYRKVPEQLSRRQRDLFEQSIAMLKMAQVAPEDGPNSAGQILASLPPGNWNICWPRDATYSILALNRLGLFQEARQGLDFFAKARVGQFEKFLGHAYGISVCRYFGDGQEESDVNQHGPNVELDSFGLYLMAVCDYVERSGDRLWLERHRTWLDNRVASLIPFLRESNGLIRQESGPWEMHLPGRQHAWTAMVSSVGLQRYARLTDQPEYAGVALELQTAMRLNLLDENGLFKGYAEARPGDQDYYDGGTLEIFAQGLFPELLEQHLHEFSKVMLVRGRGYARLSQPGWYTWSEWPFLAMRLAVAYRLHGQPERAPTAARAHHRLRRPQPQSNSRALWPPGRQLRRSHPHDRLRRRRLHSGPGRRSPMNLDLILPLMRYQPREEPRPGPWGDVQLRAHPHRRPRQGLFVALPPGRPERRPQTQPQARPEHPTLPGSPAISHPARSHLRAGPRLL